MLQVRYIILTLVALITFGVDGAAQTSFGQTIEADYIPLPLNDVSEQILYRKGYVVSGMTGDCSLTGSILIVSSY